MKPYRHTYADVSHNFMNLSGKYFTFLLKLILVISSEAAPPSAARWPTASNTPDIVTENKINNCLNGVRINVDRQQTFDEDSFIQFNDNNVNHCLFYSNIPIPDIPKSVIILTDWNGNAVFTHLPSDII